MHNIVRRGGFGLRLIDLLTHLINVVEIAEIGYATQQLQSLLLMSLNLLGFRNTVSIRRIHTRLTAPRAMPESTPPMARHGAFCSEYLLRALPYACSYQFPKCLSQLAYLCNDQPPIMPRSLAKSGFAPRFCTYSEPTGHPQA